MLNNPFIHLIQTPLGYYIYDVNRNTILSIGEESYIYLKKLKGGLNVDICQPKEIADLVADGFLSSKRASKIEHPMTNRLESELNTNIRQMTLQVTKQCNFRCTYCVYGEVAFDKQRKHEADFMSLSTAKAAIDFLYSHSGMQDEVVVGFYGGEPLLSYELIKNIILYANEKFKHKKISYTMTTNAALLTLDKAKFLLDNNCSLVFSFDGPETIQNANRKFATDGKGSFKTVYENIKSVITTFPDCINKLSINAVVDPRNKYDEIVNFFESDPIMKRLSTRRSLIDDSYFVEKTIPTDNYIIAEKSKKFFSILSKYNLCNDAMVSKLTTQDLKLEVQKTTESLRSYYELNDIMAPGGPCIPGQRRAFVSTDGTIYPCERVSETTDAFKIGNIQTGFDISKASKLLNIAQLTEEKCKNCWALVHCTLCARHCDNNGELSSIMKTSYCHSVRETVESKMRLYILLSELQNRYKL